MVVTRPQVNFEGTPTPGSSHMLFRSDPACLAQAPQAVVYAAGIYEADLEGGGSECGFRLEGAWQGRFSLAGGTNRPAAPTNMFCLNAQSNYNILESRLPDASVNFPLANRRNLLLGFFDTITAFNPTAAGLVYSPSTESFLLRGAGGLPGLYGRPVWGDATQAQGLSGKVLCENLQANRACESTYVLPGMTERPCGEIQTTRFLALCR
jgi:hypothetical protein